MTIGVAVFLWAFVVGYFSYRIGQWVWFVLNG